ncbi:tryptophan 7-halogenase [Kitasatospora aureofaciens]|uniref:tryptophan halogenase family protein n=1 Tax=Kitasatospora aureofaciens TaxID=1894 RepID=UPI001C48384F|nr:tryptophan halogenase family protein [Kitasatospora aureofaciens]MBV6698082.1 tryptophan 7-halogenase [Kitasatospora aureofaciens]
MDTRIRNVIVLGSGPAAWMSAAYLGRELQGTVSVTVLEEPENAAGHGVERALPSFRGAFLDVLGIPEDDWLRACAATFSMADRYVNWRTAGPAEARPRELPGARPDAFYHSFGLLPEYDRLPLSHYWQDRRHRGETVEPFDYACFREPPLLDARRSPCWLDGRAATRFGWHFDRRMFTGFLRRYATARPGVRRVRGVLAGVERDEHGDLSALRTTAGDRLGGQLFLDCTADRRLTGAVLAEPFLDLREQLPCDAAVSVSVPQPDGRRRGIEPHSTLLAMPAGRAGLYPVLGRAGADYVYAREFATRDEAARDLCRLWGLDPARTEVHHQEQRAGRARRAWVRNCVAVGPAAGVLEPGGTDGLHLVVRTLQLLVGHFPSGPPLPVLTERFNRAVACSFDEARDFVQIRYGCSPRTDTPFWRAARGLALSGGVRTRTELYRAGLTAGSVLAEEARYYGYSQEEPLSPWSDADYYCVLSGLGLETDGPPPALAHRPDSVRGAGPVFERVRRQQRNLLDTLPDAYTYLRRLHGR